MLGTAQKIRLMVAAMLLASLTVYAQVQDKSKAQPPARDKPAEQVTKPIAPATKPSDGEQKAAPTNSQSKSDANEDRDDEDREAILESADKFVIAYNAHDAKAVAELFAVKAEFTDEDGNLIQGREAIEKDFADMFAEHPECQINVDTTSIRVLTPHIAVEEGFVHGQPDPDDAINISSYIAVHVKVDGRWLIASVSDYEEATEELTPHDQLQELAWLVGDWLDESPDSVVKTSCRWDHSGNFLLMDFEVQIAAGQSKSGTMRIGWDPLSRQPKSWTFDAAGGHSEGLWTRVDNEWIVKVQGVNADGDVTSAVNVFRHVDDDTMTWRSYDRFIGGLAEEEIPVNVIKRHPPGPEL